MSESGYSHKYDDIIDLPHPVSAKRAHMSMIDRGAQFSPFAALTGFEAAISETARLTDAAVDLDESSKAALDEKIRILKEKLDTRPEVTVTYFVPDKRKAGGAYVSRTGNVKKIDIWEQVLILEDTEIPFDVIVELSGEVFHRREIFREE